MFFLLHFINSITIIIFNSYDEWLSIDLKYDKWYVLHEIILLVLHLEAFISYSSLYSHIRSKRKYGTVLKKSINNSPVSFFGSAKRALVHTLRVASKTPRLYRNLAIETKKELG